MNKSQKLKEFFASNMFPDNKKNKLKQRKKNEMKEESYLNYTTIRKYTFCFLFFFIR